MTQSPRRDALPPQVARREIPSTKKNTHPCYRVLRELDTMCTKETQRKLRTGDAGDTNGTGRLTTANTFNSGPDFCLRLKDGSLLFAAVRTKWLGRGLQTATMRRNSYKDGFNLCQLLGIVSELALAISSASPYRPMLLVAAAHKSRTVPASLPSSGLDTAGTPRGIPGNSAGVPSMQKTRTS
jgi:hypothetical protein